MKELDKGLLERMAKYITEYQRENGQSPGQRDIAVRCMTNSKRTFKYVHALANSGRIELSGDGTIVMPRSMDSSDYELVPLVGEVRCGAPSLAIEGFKGMFKVPREFIGTGDFFMLMAEGDSMEGAGIEEGDYLIIREQPTADPGDIVVALKESEFGSEDADATLKRFIYKNGKPILHPENEKYGDIDAAEYRIVGKLAGFYRKI